MKDKLTFKCKRIYWSNIIGILGLNADFLYWCNHPRKKIRSIDRLAYLYLLSTRGRSFIKMVREDPKLTDPDYFKKIINHPWIKEVD